MKTNKWLMTLVLLICGCMSVDAQQVNYTITGTWPGATGRWVVWNEMDGGEEHPTDSVKVAADGTFAFKGAGEMRRVTLKMEKRLKKTVLLDNEPIILNVETDAKGKSRITCKGSDDQEIITKNITQKGTRSLVKFAMLLSLSRNKANKAKFDSLNVAFDSMLVSIDKGIDLYLDSISDSYAAPYLIEDYYMGEKGYEVSMEKYAHLSTRVKDSSTGKYLKRQLEKMSKVNVGGVAPDFTLPTPDGKMLSLKSLRGHVVLLDFWASWCGPCLREAPNVRNIYEKYHSKGLEVLGVSMDTKKDAWVKAIKEKNLPWIHVSSLKEFDCPVGKMFNVTAIPRMYIIDENGKIVAQDLRGEELAKKMDDIFANK